MPVGRVIEGPNLFEVPDELDRSSGSEMKDQNLAHLANVTRQRRVVEVDDESNTVIAQARPLLPPP